MGTEAAPPLGSSRVPTASGQPATVDERYFSPVLADPRLSKVRLALEDKNDVAAESALKVALSGRKSADPEWHRWQYLLGVIEERLGALPSAVRAYQEVTGTLGALQSEAHIHLTELFLASKDCDGAKAALTKLSQFDVSERELVSYRSEVALCEGAVDVAKGQLSELILSSRRDSERARHQLRLAELQSASVDPCDAKDALRLDEIASLLKQATQSVGVSEALLNHAAALWSKMTCQKDSSAQYAMREQAVQIAERLIEKRRAGDARDILLGWELEGGRETVPVELGCRYRFALGQIAAALGKRQESIEHYQWVSGNCPGDDLPARSLYSGAGQFSSLKKYAEAIGLFGELQRRFPSHRLADDAHLKTAHLYRTIGSDKQFTEMLDCMPEKYPSGDMTQEGLFLLALRAMQERNWGAALLVLERAHTLALSTQPASDSDRDRLNYFLARAREASGDRAGAISILQELIAKQPMSYYMLLAHPTLRRMDAVLADSAVAQAVDLATHDLASPAVNPSHFERSVQRVLVLLAAGDLNRAASVLDTLDDSNDTLKPISVMVGLYLQAGAFQTALSLAKSKPQALRSKWPVAHWAALWRLLYPVPYRDIVRGEASRNKIAESLIYAIMREESEFDPRAVSHADAYGLMQLIIPTATTVAKGTGYTVTPKTLLIPAVNIALGSRELAKLLNRFQGRDALAIAGYNAGPGRPARWMRDRPSMPLDVWIESIDISETRNYVKRVLSSQATYRWLYDLGENPNVLPAMPLELQVD